MQGPVRSECESAKSNIPLLSSAQDDFMLSQLETVRVYPP